MYTPNPLRFGTFELDVHSRELRSGSTSVRLQGQPFEILCLLLEHRGTVVTREQLRRRLWPVGTFVDYEHSLNAAIKRLRTALGEDADQPQFVETVPRRGYRMIAALQDPGGAPPTRVAGSPRLRLAVLPFSNLSGDTSQEYFSDGVTEEGIAQLGRLCRARARITARLIETATEADLWSETYDSTASDWLSVQADVASDVAQSVVKELAPHPMPVPLLLSSRNIRSSPEIR